MKLIEKYKNIPDKFIQYLGTSSNITLEKMYSAYTKIINERDKLLVEQSELSLKLSQLAYNDANYNKISNQLNIVNELLNWVYTDNEFSKILWHINMILINKMRDILHKATVTYNESEYLLAVNKIKKQGDISCTIQVLNELVSREKKLDIKFSLDDIILFKQMMG